MSPAVSLSFFLLAVAAAGSLAADYGKGNLKLDVVSENFVQGTFTTVSGSGIHFSCGVDSLLVTTMDGHPLIVGESAVGEFRVLTIDGNDFVLKGDTQYAVPRSLPSVRGSTDANRLGSLVRKLDGISRVAHNQRFESSIGVMITRPETALLKAAAFALGEDAGVTGLEYPVVVPFYRVALTVESIFLNETAPASDRQKRASYKCNDRTTCPPCTDGSCVGLCGRTCTCWSFVCGDCCFHQFCFSHDLCCKEQGFYSFACFGVITTGGVLSASRCDSTYNCPS